jgi:hypothetical protein
MIKDQDGASIASDQEKQEISDRTNGIFSNMPFD